MNTRRTAQDNEMHESLSGYFERSALVVRQYADSMEHHYARPALNYASEHFHSHPILVTFLTIFCSLAFLPVLSFIGLSTFAVSSIVLFAFGSAAIAAIIIELMFVAFLVFALWSLFIVAVTLTSFVIFAYVTIRLGVLVNSDGRSAVQEWVCETRRQFSPFKAEEGKASDGFAIINQNAPGIRVKIEDTADD
ncbi:hypothetical protein F5I97DRAFT_1900664 [Phlebopus sp. FC_14]|nr:hypothetical protein F5I97DRAFT_1900664 [Phlebopus sp. FC_14]